MNIRRIRLPQSNKGRLSLAIIVSGLLIALTIFFATVGTALVQNALSSIWPRFAKYQKIGNISVYSIDNIINSQPKLSYNNNSKYVLVEYGHLNCLNCARFHGFGVNNVYSKILLEYIKPGYFDYVWVDNNPASNLKKSASLYCAGEQKISSFFGMQDLIFKNYLITFDLPKAKEYAKELGLDEAKFEECFNSNKYDERIQKLTMFSQSLGNSTDTANLYLYSIETTQVKNIEGKLENKITVKEVANTKSDLDYKQFIELPFNKALGIQN
jgi:hypothetical protein